MKKNVYYKDVYCRVNVINLILDHITTGIGSWSNMLVEVFLRRNFGERYFTLATAITVICILFFIPIGLGDFFSFSRHYSRSSSGEFWAKYTTWYLFIVAFAYFSFLRLKETYRNPSTFDFEKFSLSSGYKFLYYKIEKEDKVGWINHRNYEILIEPAMAIFIGALLRACGQPLGILFIVVGVILFFSKSAVYRGGDKALLDKIDEIICNEDLGEILSSRPGTVSKRGLEHKGKQPRDPKKGQLLADEFSYDAEFEDIY